MDENEKATWRQTLRSNFKTLDKRKVLIYAVAGILYISGILLMIILPIKLLPATPASTAAQDLNVGNNNNYLPDSCPIYTVIASSTSGAPLSEGRLQLPFQRPTSQCRTFTSDAMEKLITNMTSRMVDKDLARLFENAYPNTLDTTISWYTLDESNPLSYVITGDIPAQWIRDAAHQFAPYLPLLPYDANLRALFRGLINLEARHIASFPYCNAFQPPTESGLAPQSTPSNVRVVPSIDSTVYQCKWEIDSLASFLRLSWGYYQYSNGDSSFINSNWQNAVQSIMKVLQAQSLPTINADGSVNVPAYTYQPGDSRATDQLILGGYGSPSIANGLVRSAFRPSDDSTIFQLFIPANAQLSVSLQHLSQLLNATNQLTTIASQAANMSQVIRQAIYDHAIINSTDGQIFAYEIDGMGGINFMDDANVPSLMSLPYIGFVDNNDTIYTSTRQAILSSKNPYWFHSTSSNMSGIGGPHRGLNRIWPMNWILQLNTSTSVAERTSLLNLLKTTTAGRGLIHENFDVSEVNGSGFGRLWFAWVNSLFGEVLLNMAMEDGTLGAEILFGQGQKALNLEDVLGT